MNYHINAAIKLQCDSPSEKFVLFALANRADTKEICFPSIARIASDTGLSERTISRSLKTLEQKTWIKKITGHTGYSNRYLMTIPGQEEEKKKTGKHTPDTMSPTPDTMSPTPDTMSPPPMTPCLTKHQSLTTTKPPLEAPRQLLSQKAAQLEADYPLTAEYRPDVIELAAKGRDINGKLLFNVEKYLARFEAAIESKRC
jgi:DNA-binding MarR family transcriptional regulator